MARILVSGGAGFVGSHLCRRLVLQGDEVVAVDNLCTGSRANVADLEGQAGFRFVAHDVTAPLALDGPLDAILHLASPASPVDYQRLSLETLAVGSTGTRNLLDLALAKGARFLLASTSEVYGDPEEHPQPETYWGKVNPIGPRACYDESKRFAEALTTTTHRVRGADVRIVRLFNTYGPNMQVNDGRVVPNFICQALRGLPLTVYGDGRQTRSFCYVSDTVEGILGVLASPYEGPVNIGNPREFTMLELAEAIGRILGVAPTLTRVPLPVDDPKVRRPDIAKARALFGFDPRVPLEEGLVPTIAYFRRALGLA
jgi:dTDP-glucose 4,6-dehydratase